MTAQQVANKFHGSKRRRYPGRPAVDRAVEELVLCIATDNRDWGYEAMAWAFEASLATVFAATGTEEEAATQRAHAAVMVDLERAVIRAMARLARGERELTGC